MRVSIALILVAFLALPALATIPWTPEDAARARTSYIPGERPAPPGPGERFSGDNYADFQQAAWFVASLQVSDSLSIDFGGIREAEHLLDIIQSDNTSESIWFFTRYYELTGDTSLMGNLRASWEYITTHPAYNEEGGSDGYGGYYRMYNCGWALRAQMKYVDVFNDLSYSGYADSCANYIATHNLIRLGTTGFYNLVNPPVLSWAAGNLYEYGTRAADSVWVARAALRGNRVKGWIAADSLILSNEEWAMSAGAVMWGMLESYFREYPDSLGPWLGAHLAEFDTLADAGDWENAWNGWYALGMKRLEEATGDPIWGTRHLWMTDYLRSFDTDDDGGIQASPLDTDAMDQAWVTSYLGFMGFDPLLSVSTGIALSGGPPRSAALFPNRPNPFNPATTISFHLPDAAEITLDVLSVAGRRVTRLVEGPRGAGDHAVVWRGVDGLGRDAPSGVYFYRLDAGRYSETRKMLLIR
ncbi:MAG: FlgD immunoglobulin-like domain containing protein [Candidatus Eisenbacteria bacterium]